MQWSTPRSRGEDALEFTRKVGEIFVFAEYEEALHIHEAIGHEEDVVWLKTMLSDHSKRTMYNAGVYDPGENEEDLLIFLKK
ncbi:Hypothetical predicted protein [Olea europaea subsp. europaea]|uniref:Uncharacterized protein n=1 Tax=Olea europaea subsp. europaea TaxID=158383 RepID=A0A8S0QWD8_OLEEU|nr:Hypothetical predicted protein [Olea europaea subsp. europaea]